MVKDGIFYALGLGVVATILGYLTGSITLVALPLVLALFFLQFFRNPKRRIPTEPGLVVSPADGVVTDVEWVETKNGSRLRLSVFLSVFDVHVNRAPVSGTVTAVEYRKGQFKNAMSREASLLNEQTMVVVDAGGYEVSFKLIAGLLARRIVCGLKVGDVVERGQLIGMIKFGSRADILMPADAELKVAKGTRVKGGATILAVVPSVAEMQANLSRAVGA
jgi:phosphatidylserine decarboxylase